MKRWGWFLPFLKRLMLLSLATAFGFVIDYYLLLIPIPDLPLRFLKCWAFFVVFLLLFSLRLYTPNQMTIPRIIDLYFRNLLASTLDGEVDDMQEAMSQVVAYRKRIQAIQPSTDKMTQLISLLIDIEVYLDRTIHFYQPS